MPPAGKSPGAAIRKGKLKMVQAFPPRIAVILITRLRQQVVAAVTLIVNLLQCFQIGPARRPQRFPVG
jgi:hypothetical protein